jgi:hypothetical protein
VLRVLDQWSRQSLLLEVGTRMSGLTRGQAFDRVWEGVREPRSILVAHETNFQSPALEAWAYHRSMSSTSFSPVNQ